MTKIFKVRTAELSGAGNGRTSFRFEPTTWAAIDTIALSKNVRWQDWAREVIAQKPGTPNMSAVIRAAVADELLAEQFAAMADVGPTELAEDHPIVGAGYYRVDDDQLAIELAGATTTKDDSFGSFVLHIGHRSSALGGEPFVIIENLLKGQLHLMIAPTVEV